MTLAYKWIFALALIGLGLPAVADTPARSEYTRTIKKEFGIAPNGTTAISNKYGKVDIKTWDRERVKIAVTIVVNARSEDDAQDVFDRIQVDFSNASDYVKAETNIEPRKSRWFSWNDNSKSDYRINYEVYLPKTNNLEIEHRYGDLYVSAISGKVNMDVKYVNFKLEELGDDSRVSFSYGNGAINRARDLIMAIGYGKLNLEEAMDLNMETKYSEVRVGKADDVNCETKYDTYAFEVVRDFRNTGKYDNFSIGRADNVELQSKYTQFDAGYINQNIDLDMEYGGAVFALTNNFTECQINGRYTDFALTVPENAEYQLDAATTYAGIRYPRELNVQFEKEQSSSHELRGSVGNGRSKILARLTYGSLKVRTE